MKSLEKKLKKDFEKLKRRLSRDAKKHEVISDDETRYRIYLERACQALDIAMEALNFYSTKNWGKRSHQENIVTDMEWDSGSTARKALVRIENKLSATEFQVSLGVIKND